MRVVQKEISRCDICNRTNRGQKRGELRDGRIVGTVRVCNRCWKNVRRDDGIVINSDINVGPHVSETSRRVMKKLLLKRLGPLRERAKREIENASRRSPAGGCKIPEMFTTIR